jgi:hypothetical protein
MTGELVRWEEGPGWIKMPNQDEMTVSDYRKWAGGSDKFVGKYTAFAKDTSLNKTKRLEELSRRRMAIAILEMGNTNELRVNFCKYFLSYSYYSGYSFLEVL